MQFVSYFLFYLSIECYYAIFLLFLSLVCLLSGIGYPYQCSVYKKNNKKIHLPSSLTDKRLNLLYRRSFSLLYCLHDKVECNISGFGSSSAHSLMLSILS